MKLRGMYIARQLSFSGVLFSILDVPLTNDYLETYDRSVQLVRRRWPSRWIEEYLSFQWIDIKEKLAQAFDLADTATAVRNHVTARYWLSHQRFFKYLCIACKVAKVVELSRQAVLDGKVSSCLASELERCILSLDPF
jgi:integrase